MNISKKCWPLVKPKEYKNRHVKCIDYYFVFDLPKRELGNYFNTWYVGYSVIEFPKTYIKHYITLKQVDAKTSYHLYGKNIAPVTVILVHHEVDSVKLKLSDYILTAKIRSIDDSSYTTQIIFKEENVTNAIQSFESIMRYIDNQKRLNGEDLIMYCKSLGECATYYD